MVEQQAFRLKIPEAVTKYLKPDAPKPVRMMAAKGLVPMAPQVLITALTFFLADADEEIREAARSSLLGMPESMLSRLLSEELHPKTLDFFARQKTSIASLIQPILLNPLTPDDSIAFLAEKVPENLVTIVARNDVRLLRCPVIAEALKKNPNALKSEVDRVVSFLRINGIQLEGESPELTVEEITQILQEQEPELSVELPAELLEEDEDEDPSGAADEARKNVLQLIQSLSVAEKVKLALRGNKEARGVLIKDSNKIVSTTVIKSPKLTDGEVLSIAQMRSVHDDVIRIIANTGDWVKNYNIQVALASNPKTPFPIALKFLRVLRVSDLQKLAGNKNISSQLSKLAKEFYVQKRQ